MKVSLGCPYYHEGWVCVDVRPLEPGVVKADAYEFLKNHPNAFTEIYSKNMLEHLPDVGKFLELCHEALVPGGILRFETDHALWFPFYIPHMAWFFPKRSWIGAAVNPDFNEYMNGSPHLYVFTLYHLRVFATLYHFQIKVLKRIKHGAHLYGEFVK